MSNYKVCVCCNKEQSVEAFEKDRNQCKQCRSEIAKERRNKKKKEDIVAFKCYEMSASAHARAFAKSRKNKKCYRSIESPYGFSGIKEMSDFLYANFYYEIKELLDSKEVPSVDRIDSNYGYTPNNIRIISHFDNTADGVNQRKRRVKVTDQDGIIVVYESLTECAKAFGKDYESYARGWIRGLYVAPYGYKFEYAHN